MAKVIGRNQKKITQKRKTKNGIINRIKFAESYTSLIMGFIVVLIVGILILAFAKGIKNTQTSSVSDISKIEKQTLKDSATSSAYTIKPGDDLWTISENIYHNGYKWVEIAKLNKLENPGLIYAGNKLIIPAAAQKEQIAVIPTAASKITNNTAENNSIMGSTYIIKKGDNLWNVAVRAYGDGFKWPEIAKANNLTNPSLIHPGNIFKIPR